MKIEVFLAGAAIALSATGAQAANLITNGDFASPNVGGGWTIVANGTVGWTNAAENAVEIGANGVYGLPCFSSAVCQNLEVNAYTFGSVSQTVNVVAGKTYDVSWAYGGRTSGDPAALNVYFDGALLATDTSANSFGKWTVNTFTYTPTVSGPASLVFASIPGGDTPSYGNEITAVSVSVPEPATWAMMILGLAGLGLALRARRTSAVALGA